MFASKQPHQLPEQQGQSSPPEAQVFDYATLDCETRIVVQQRTGEIKERIHNAAQLAWEIGQKLADVRSRLRPRQFTFWLQTEFQLSRRTAYNYINVFESFPIRANFAQINIATSALYLLAAPSTSEEARQDALERANKGENITHTEAKAIRTRHKNAVAPKSSTKPVTVDVPASVLECESFTKTLTNISEGEFAEIEPMRYATPLQTSKEAVEDIPAIRVSQNKQEVAEREANLPQNTEEDETVDAKPTKPEFFEKEVEPEASSLEASVQLEEVVGAEISVNSIKEKDAEDQFGDVQPGEAADKPIGEEEVGSFNNNGYLNPSNAGCSHTKFTEVAPLSSENLSPPKTSYQISEICKILSEGNFSKEELANVVEVLVYLLGAEPVGSLVNKSAKNEEEVLLPREVT